MRNARKHSFLFVSGKTLAKTLLASLAITTVCAAQRSRPVLQITSPADGAVVNPGQTISVRVDSSADVAFTHVGVVGEDPLGSSDVATSLPARFSFTIPTDVSCRKYMLTAVGTTASGQSADSATILIDVERPDLPKNLSALMSRIAFGAVREQSPIKISATFPDGKTLDVTESSLVDFSSSDTSVVTVDHSGIVTALSPGNASVTVTYRLSEKTVQVKVPVTVPPRRK